MAPEHDPHATEVTDASKRTRLALAATGIALGLLTAILILVD